MKIHSLKLTKTTLCGLRIGFHIIKLGTYKEITCKKCLKIINKQFDLKEPTHKDIWGESGAEGYKL